MADVTISDLPLKTELLDSDMVVVDSGTQSHRMYYAQFKTLFLQTFQEYFVDAAGDTINGVLQINNGKEIMRMPAAVGALAFGPVNAMPGYLLCNGQAVSRTDYADLFAAIGTNFGAGDGTSTFNVPDYRGCFLRGLGGNSADDMYTKQPMALPEHDHIMNAKGTFDGNYLTNRSKNYSGGGGGSFGAGSINTSIRTGNASESNSVYGAASEVRPVNYAVNFFIKY